MDCGDTAVKIDFVKSVDPDSKIGSKLCVTLGNV